MAEDVEGRVLGVDENSRPAQSNIACQACRKRKIKCGRELPHCTVCTESRHMCEYPPGPLKPGPKIGTSHRSRKRQRMNVSEKASSSNEVSDRCGRRASRDSGGNEPESDNIHISLEPRRASQSASTIFATQPAATSQAQPSPSFFSRPIYAEQTQGSIVEPSGPLDAEHCATRDRPPPSPVTTAAALSPGEGSLNIQNLSFIVHPSHESCTPGETADEAISPVGEPLMLARAWVTFGVRPETLYRLKDLFFENMTAFSLFQASQFESKAQSITSTLHLHALLAAMFSFSAHFIQPEARGAQGRDMENYDSPAPTSEHFAELAARFVDEALRKCGDETPPLCVLQALILTTFQQLIRGVKGNAWRSLGTCVRIAYELNLHLIDSEDLVCVNLDTAAERSRWCADEERRRAWWAIWEMDTFASTVRRCPSAIDWSQNETALPVDDETWFQSNPQRSCFLEKNPINRWKALPKSGNKSPKAWFIVVNSLMRDAQLLSSPRGVFRSNNHSLLSTRDSKDISERLGAISNALRCFSLAPPQSLKYHNQYLGFGVEGAKYVVSPRNTHSSIYSIHLMTQLATFMISHYHVFGPIPRTTCSTESLNNSDYSVHSQVYPDNIAFEKYFEAADNILTVLNRSCDDHVRYVNPFLASTVWLAAAVQLVRKVFGVPGTNADLAKSKFEVLHLHYKQFVSYWGISTALQQNLEVIETSLERLYATSRTRGIGVGAASSDDYQHQSNNNNHSLQTNCTCSRCKERTYDRTYSPNDTGIEPNRTIFASPNVSLSPRQRLPGSPKAQQQQHIIPNATMYLPAQTQPLSEHQNVTTASEGLVAVDTPDFKNMIAEGGKGGGTNGFLGGEDFAMGLGLTEAELQDYLDRLLSGTYVA
ncbi:hypothetical protein AOQ84DRAFT_189457 [Glonium stellatum]|uniref:Zn(2)-C6 fungal-type domain-containing protein n=1 Tax=Glonium stellatum TaxID=574774 RepID=A0A8E2FDD8_9PEZI|nr:hypothetical protein AOQ84DRAFT_189457 [Glonium stellatum]